jgi:hypothetical protein
MECSRVLGGLGYCRRAHARRVRQVLGRAHPSEVVQMGLEADAQVGPTVYGQSLAPSSTIAGCFDPIVESSQEALEVVRPLVLAGQQEAALDHKAGVVGSPVDGSLDLEVGIPGPGVDTAAVGEGSHLVVCLGRRKSPKLHAHQVRYEMSSCVLHLCQHGHDYKERSSSPSAFFSGFLSSSSNNSFIFFFRKSMMVCCIAYRARLAFQSDDKVW